MKRANKLILLLYLFGILATIVTTDIFFHTSFTKATRIHTEVKDGVVSTTYRHGEVSTYKRKRTISTYLYKVDGRDYTTKIDSKKTHLTIAYYTRQPAFTSVRNSIDYYPFIMVYFILLTGFVVYRKLYSGNISLDYSKPATPTDQKKRHSSFYVLFVLHLCVIITILYHYIMGYIDNLLIAHYAKSTIGTLLSSWPMAGYYIVTAVTITILVLYQRKELSKDKPRRSHGTSHNKN